MLYERHTTSPQCFAEGFPFSRVFRANAKPERSRLFSRNASSFFGLCFAVEADLGTRQITAAGQADQLSYLQSAASHSARGRHFIRPETQPRAASSLLPSTSPLLRRVPSAPPSLSLPLSLLPPAPFARSFATLSLSHACFEQHKNRLHD